MGRVIAVVVVLGLAGLSATDVDCPVETESIEATAVELALPVLVQPSVPKPAAARWQTTAHNTGRELSERIFRPPI